MSSGICRICNERFCAKAFFFFFFLDGKPLCSAIHSLSKIGIHSFASPPFRGSGGPTPPLLTQPAYGGPLHGGVGSKPTGKKVTCP